MRALVFGASGDLGRAIVNDLAASGWNLHLHAHRNARVVDELASQFGQRSVSIADVREESQVQRVVSEALLGGDIQAVVFTAGINPTARPIRDTPLEVWRDTLDINLTGAFLVAKATVPHLREASPGRMVFVSSIFGLEAPANRGAYAVSKHGMTGLVQALAREEAPRILVNAVCPGPMWTESVRRIFTKHANERNIDVEEYVKERLSHIPFGRFLRLEECAQTVTWLLSDKCNFITGEAIRITGGSAT